MEWLIKKKPQQMLEIKENLHPIITISKLVQILCLHWFKKALCPFVLPKGK